MIHFIRAILRIRREAADAFASQPFDPPLTDAEWYPFADALGIADECGPQCPA